MVGLIHSSSIGYMSPFSRQVLDRGKQVEYDHPYILLHEATGIFHQMALQTGPSGYEELKAAALQAYSSRTRVETGGKFYQANHWVDNLT